VNADPRTFERAYQEAEAYPATQAGTLAKATPYVWRDPDTIPRRQWVYGRHIQRGHVRGLIAQGGAGKTILSVGEALSMVTGRPLLGHAVPDGPKRVWLWNLEDDGDELARIVQAACKHWRIGKDALEGRLFVDSALDGAVLKLATSTASDGLVINKPLVESLTAELIERGIDYLHVDPFVSSHAANESDNMEVDTIAKEWARVAHDARAAIGLAHHVSKAGAAEVTALSARGAVALINACRSVLTINRMSEIEASGFGVEEKERRRYFRAYDDKNNRAPPSDQSDWYRLVSVELGNGQNDCGDSIGVVVPWSPPDAFEGVTAQHLYQVQCRVSAKRYRESSQATEWVGHAVAEIIGCNSTKEHKADRARVSKVLRQWIANGALSVVEAPDEKGTSRKWVEVGHWAVDSPPVTSG
jgi:hypothetical protein